MQRDKDVMMILGVCLWWCGMSLSTLLLFSS